MKKESVKRNRIFTTASGERIPNIYLQNSPSFHFPFLQPISGEFRLPIGAISGQSHSDSGPDNKTGHATGLSVNNRARFSRISAKLHTKTRIRNISLRRRMCFVKMLSPAVHHPSLRPRTWLGQRSSGSISCFLFSGKFEDCEDPSVFLKNGLTFSEKNNTMETDVMSVIMATKRIHNPVTGKYYELRQRSTVNGEAGTD